jgi:6-phosphofructokinase
LASNSDVEQAYALGEAAVEMALDGKNSIMPAIIRTSNNPYQWEIGCGELKDIANVEKMMPTNYISEDGFSITDECREYLLPLIEGENYPPYINGLPDYVVLKKSKVDKKLPPFEL